MIDRLSLYEIAECVAIGYLHPLIGDQAIHVGKRIADLIVQELEHQEAEDHAL